MSSTEKVNELLRQAEALLQQAHGELDYYDVRMKPVRTSITWLKKAIGTTQPETAILEERAKEEEEDLSHWAAQSDLVVVSVGPTTINGRSYSPEQ